MSSYSPIPRCPMTSLSENVSYSVSKEFIPGTTVSECLNQASHESHNFDCQESDGCGDYTNYNVSNGAGALIIWFLVLFIIILIAIYALRPSSMLRGYCNELETWKVLLASFVIALFIIIIVYMIRSFTSC